MIAVRKTDKPSELERTVSKLRNEIKSASGLMNTKGNRLPQLIQARTALQSVSIAASNALICSLLYSNDSYRSQLETTRSEVVSLLNQAENKIQTRVKMSVGGFPTQNIIDSFSSIINSESQTQGYTALSSDTGPIPVFYLKFNNAADQSGYVHRMYTIWFKSTTEFVTGFAAWPPAVKWNTLKNSVQLRDKVREALTADGFGERNTP